MDPIRKLLDWLYYDTIRLGPWVLRLEGLSFVVRYKGEIRFRIDDKGEVHVGS